MAMATRSGWFNRVGAAGDRSGPGNGDVGGLVGRRRPGASLISFAIMAAFGTLLPFGGRSETVRGMRGDDRDERWAMNDLRAMALAGLLIGRWRS